MTDRDYGREIDWLRMLMDERDRRYEERFIAQERAREESLRVSERAVNASSKAQDAYNEHTNNLRDQLGRQAKEFLPLALADARFAAIEERISGLRESRSEGKGRSDQSVYLVGLGLALLAIAMRWLG